MFDAALQINPDAAVTIYNRATALANAGRIDESIAAFQAAIKIDPQNANAHNNLAMVLAQKKQYGEAVFYLNKAVEIDPNHLNARLNIGKLYIEQGQMAEAVKIYQKIIQTNPVPEEIIVAGKSLIDMNQLKAAEIYFEIATRQFPMAEWTYNNLAYVLARQNKNKDAIECFHQILAINPDSKTARQNINFLMSQSKTPLNKNSHTSE